MGTDSESWCRIGLAALNRIAGGEGAECQYQYSRYLGLQRQCVYCTFDECLLCSPSYSERLHARTEFRSSQALDINALLFVCSRVYRTFIGYSRLRYQGILYIHMLSLSPIAMCISGAILCTWCKSAASGGLPSNITLSTH